jgi:hypothetical protein
MYSNKLDGPLMASPFANFTSSVTTHLMMMSAITSGIGADASMIAVDM